MQCTKKQLNRFALCTLLVLTIFKCMYICMFIDTSNFKQLQQKGEEKIYT